jgi:hypothetical protein
MSEYTIRALTMAELCERNNGAGMGNCWCTWFHFDTPDQKVAASFLYNATRPVFERAGFSYVRPKGTKNCLMRRWVDPVPASA